MTVKEIIEVLQKFDPETVCFCEDGLNPSDLYPIAAVDLRESKELSLSFLPGSCEPGKQVVIISS